MHPVELSAECEACKAFADHYKTDTPKVGDDPSRILMQFETDGSLSAREVLLAALDLLSKRFAEVAGAAETLG